MKNLNSFIGKMNDEHEAFVEDTLGWDFLARSRENELFSEKELLEANKKIAEELYGKNLQSALWDNNLPEIKRIYNQNVVKNILEKKTIPQELDMEKYGIVVVRPELMDVLPQCKEFLATHGLRTIFEKDDTISFDQYWGMYNIGLKFADPKTTLDFPTRTANYINLPCHMILVGTDENLNISTSDFLQTLKGKAGHCDETTLRGSLATEELKKYISTDGKDLEPDARIALDPIGMYRGLVDGRITSDNAHADADIQIMHYVGQGVHIPDNTELSNDLKILLTQDEIDSIQP